MPTGPDSDYFKQALARDVLYVPGEFCFFPDSGVEPCHSGMRLSYGFVGCDQIAEGTRRLGELACQMMSAAAPAAKPAAHAAQRPYAV